MKKLLWIVSALALAYHSSAHARTFTVTKPSDTMDGICNSDCSLREAIQAANLNQGPDTIVLKGTTYRLSIPTPRPPEQDDNVNIDEEANRTGDFDITGDLLIRGVKGFTAIDAGRVDRVFDINSNVTVELRDFEIRNGSVRERGGAISNLGSTKLASVRLRLNLAASGFNLGQGGAIFNGGTMSIVDSHILQNSAHGGEASLGEGGGIYNTGQLSVSATRFIGNVTSDDNDIGGGGAIMNRGGNVTVSRSFFQANGTSQHGYGGAIANRSGGTASLENSTISGNTSGEATDGGGAIANGTRGGDAGTLMLNYVTVADNDGGGLFNGGDIIYFDSIIAGNYENYGSSIRDYSAGVNCVSLTWPITGAGSIIGLDGHNCRGLTYVDNATALTEVLHPLANNGGFAPTHALRGDFEGAIDASSYGNGTCPGVDQRGASRPFDGNNDGFPTCDVGAFERNDDD